MQSWVLTLLVLVQISPDWVNQNYWKITHSCISVSSLCKWICISNYQVITKIWVFYWNGRSWQRWLSPAPPQWLAAQLYWHGVTQLSAQWTVWRPEKDDPVSCIMSTDWWKVPLCIMSTYWRIAPLYHVYCLLIVRPWLRPWLTWKSPICVSCPTTEEEFHCVSCLLSPNCKTMANM